MKGHAAYLLLMGASLLASAACTEARPAARPADPRAPATLMSAEIGGPAPIVGTSHLTRSGAYETDVALTDPKDARPRESSRRAGGFGAAK